MLSELAEFGLPRKGVAVVKPNGNNEASKWTKVY
jgi:hypothetical protein